MEEFIFKSTQTDKQSGEKKVVIGLVINNITVGEVADKKMAEYIKSGEKKITTSTIRNVLELINKVYNQVFYDTSEELSEAQLADIAYLKTKLAYEIGRDESKRDSKEYKNIEYFIKHTRIMDLLGAVLSRKTRESYLLFCRYMECLVAYFKYHGGADK